MKYVSINVKCLYEKFRRNSNLQEKYVDTLYYLSLLFPSLFAKESYSELFVTFTSADIYIYKYIYIYIQHEKI